MPVICPVYAWYMHVICYLRTNSCWSAQDFVDPPPFSSLDTPVDSQPDPYDEADLDLPVQHELIDIFFAHGRGRGVNQVVHTMVWQWYPRDQLSDTDVVFPCRNFRLGNDRQGISGIYQSNTNIVIILYQTYNYHIPELKYDCHITEIL